MSSPVKNHPSGNETPNLTTGHRPLPIGWFALIVPVVIVLSVGLFQGEDFVKERSRLEATNAAQNHLTLGEIAVRKGDLQGAYSQFMTALEMDPDFGDAHLNLGILFQERGDYQKAAASYQKALRLSPSQSSQIYNNLGIVYEKMGRNEDAIATFNKALAKAGMNSITCRNIAESHKHRKDYRLAAAAYRAAIEHQPTLATTYRDMLQGAALSEKDSTALKGITKSLAEGIEEIDLSRYDALIFDRYTVADPTLAENYLDLSQAELKLGDTLSAYENLKKAIELQPGVSAAHNRLGILLARRGDYQSALHEFEEALRLDPSNDEASSNLRRCQTLL